MNIIETLKSQVGMSLAKHSASFFEEEHSHTSSAVNGTFAAILAGMVQRVSYDKGAKDLHKILKNQKYKEYDIEDIFTRSPQTVNGLVNRGTHFLPSIYPGRLREATNAISEESSVKKLTSSKLMKVSAPLVLNALAKHVNDNKLDANGLKSFLSGQKSNIKDDLPKGFADRAELTTFGWDKNKVVKEEPKPQPVVEKKVEKRVEERVQKNVEKEIVKEERVAPVKEAAVNTGGGMGFLKWLIPLILILAIGAFLLSKVGCNSADKVVSTVAAPVEAVTDVAKDAGNAVANVFGKVNDAALAALDNITFAAGSAGSQMLGFIKGGGSDEGRFRFNNLNFASGSAIIDGETGVEVDNLSAILKAYPDVKVKVEGYTDSQGDPTNNQTLSLQRAEAVKTRLVAQGIDVMRISTEGFGAANPIGDNATPEGRAENRRIEVVIAK